MGVQFPVVVVVRALDRVTEPLRKINAAAAKARAPWVELQNAFARFSSAAGLPRLRDALGQVSSSVSNLGREFLSISTRAGLVIGGLVAGAFVLVRSFGQAAEKLQNTADTLNVNVETLQAWRYAAGLADVEAADFDRSLVILARTMEAARRGNAAAAGTFARLGVSIRGPNGQLRNLEDVLPDVADALANLKDKGRAAALAQTLFGRSGAKMIPVLRDGSEGLAKMAAEARRLGAVLSSEEIRNAAQADDAFDRLSAALVGVRNALAAVFTPVVLDLVKRFTDWIVENRENIKEWAKRIARDVPAAVERFVLGIKRAWAALEPLRVLIGRVVDAIGPLGVALAVLAGIMTVSLLPAIGGVISALVALSGAIVATPAGWVVLALAAVVAALVAAAAAIAYVALRWDSLSARFPAAARLIQALAKGALAVLVFQLETTAKILDAVATAVFWSLDAFARLFEFLGAKLSPALDVTAGKLDGIGGILRTLAKFLPAGGTFGAFSDLAGVLQPAPAAATAAATPESRLQSAQPPAPAAQGRAAVRVSFDNVPRNVRVTPERSSGVDLDLGLGWSNLVP